MIITSVVIGRATQTRPNWSFDGYTYAIMMQMDRGIPYAQARHVSQRFYAGKPPATDSETAPYLKTPYPQYWQLFAPRMLYPRIASWLWPRYGMLALLLVSNASFVGCVLLLFLLLLDYAGPETAALLALGFSFVPEVQLLGRGALTDMLAMLFWVGTFWSMLRYATSAKIPWLFGYAVFATLMSLTRPLAYMPLACGAALLVVGLMKRNPRF
ncbi:MAG: glycosyltransferase family 39 protein, partial [Vulcanimicrobiaceae bacterium]